MTRTGRMGDFARTLAMRKRQTEVDGKPVKMRRPAYADDPLMAGAFAGFIAYAPTNPEIVKDFEHKTGIIFPFKQGKAAASVIERMVDEACGVSEQSLTREQKEEIFDRWVNYLIVNHWGEQGTEGEIDD